MGMTPIPFTAIHDYYILFNDIEPFEEFLYYIREMDDKFLELEESKKKDK